MLGYKYQLTINANSAVW